MRVYTVESAPTCVRRRRGQADPVLDLRPGSNENYTARIDWNTNHGKPVVCPDSEPLPVAVFSRGVFTMFMVLIFNYIQHMHTDGESVLNRCRNITGALNGLLLNNGYHDAYHDACGLHWSRLPEKHAQITAGIDPQRIEPDLAWFFFGVYILGLFSGENRTRSMRLRRIRKQTA